MTEECTTGDEFAGGDLPPRRPGFGGMRGEGADHTPNPGLKPGRPGLGHQLRLTSEDLIADLLWPRIFKAVEMGLRPGRLALGVFAVMLLGLIDSIGAAIAGEGSRRIFEIIGGSARISWLDVESVVTRLARLDLEGASLLPGAVWGMVAGPVASLFEEAPVRGWVVLPLLVVVWVMFSAAISRVTGLDFARGERVPPARAAGFAVSRWRSLLTAIGLPLGVLGALWVVLAGAGWVLLSFPVVNVVGAVLWPVMLIVGAVMVLIGAGLSLGGPLLVPAVVCELEDGIDAFQRAFGYVFRAPLRTLFYTLLAICLGVVAISVAVGIALLWSNATMFAATTWVGIEAQTRLTEGAPGAVLGVFATLPLLLVAGFAVSYCSTAATVVYLLMRRVVDGQEITELHLPGETAARIDLTMTAWARRRQELADEESSAG